jgi:arylsulfatase B
VRPIRNKAIMSIPFSLRILTVTVLLAVSQSCNKDNEEESVTSVSTAPNILLIIADDLGKDAISGFPEGTVKANTPNINALRNEGISFQNLWVYPTCSPTRASIITGKYGYRTGVKWANDELDQSEDILQNFINDRTNNLYATALIGKWHLAGSNSSFNPEIFGLDYYSGLIRGAVENYYQWQLTEDGITELETEYASEVFTDLSIDWINGQSKPWFLWLAYNAPHTPFHAPPAASHSQGTLAPYADGADPMPYYMAAIESIDFQMGRIMASIPESELENTVIIFIGDNGTPNQVAQSPYSSAKAKGTLYQGGVNVPMFISGKGVDRSGEDSSLISSTDLFATIAELAGVSVQEVHDSKSFKSLLSQNGSHRTFQYSEMNNGSTDSWAIRNEEYKLMISADGSTEMYDLVNDPYEQNELDITNLTTDQLNAKAMLEEELAVIRN